MESVEIQEWKVQDTEEITFLISAETLRARERPSALQMANRHELKEHDQ